MYILLLPSLVVFGTLAHSFASCHHRKFAGKWDRIRCKKIQFPWTNKAYTHPLTFRPYWIFAFCAVYMMAPSSPSLSLPHLLNPPSLPSFFSWHPSPPGPSCILGMNQAGSFRTPQACCSRRKPHYIQRLDVKEKIIGKKKQWTICAFNWHGVLSPTFARRFVRYGDFAVDEAVDPIRQVHQILLFQSIANQGTNNFDNKNFRDLLAPKLFFQSIFFF